MAATQSVPAPAPDPTYISLTRLLDRLRTVLLSVDADSKLQTSSLERTKVGANLEYARSLLLRLEHDAAAAKTPSRRQVRVADLQGKRDLIKQLNQRLYELNQLDDDVDDADDSDDGDGNDTAIALDVQHDAGNAGNAQLQAAPENTLRARHAAMQPASRAGRHDIATGPLLQRSEKLLSHNRAEQETLTNSLLAMAQLLKQQSMQFGSSLEAERNVLDRAAKGLDTSAQGMESAGRKMGALRRMTEGKGWWARVRLYAIIAVLWMVCILIMFVMPKLRF